MSSEKEKIFSRPSNFAELAISYGNFKEKYKGTVSHKNRDAVQFGRQLLIDGSEKEGCERVPDGFEHTIYKNKGSKHLLKNRDSFF